ncbi:nucleotide exchange factor GrpE [Clostridium baratii]|nr:nucleotide exchange factor GrpE [Clostridium baratii]KJU70787.1 heat shock protein GrpE [Clostridium baratii]MBT9832838.1 nucleotide exchange factor GrpE [Clostridium baratii]STA99242.1 heat shock protein GrpE [Clostridium baratii]
MMKDNENLENLENQENSIENEDANLNENIDIEENTEDLKEEAQVSEDKKKEEDELNMFKKYKDENKKLTNELETLKDRLLRVSAEYENYRKRTTKEKEGIYTDACIDVLKEIVPNLDNLERALEANGNIEDMKKGVEMTLKGFRTALEKLGVEEIETKDGFDPNFHQAVMHVQDENLDENSVAEVFMKGYKRGDKVIRHSVVKVAN